MSMAIDAVKRVRTVVDGRVEVDVKRYARVEKIPGGEMEDSMVRQRARERVREEMKDWNIEGERGNERDGERGW